MKVEVWSDVVCPWCYLGKRRLDAALERFDGRDQVSVFQRSFELRPDAPQSYGFSATELLQGKFGISADEAAERHRDLTELAAEEGLEYRFDLSKPGNTFDVHRVLRLARDRDLDDVAWERFFRAYLTEGEPVTEPDTILRLAVEVGLGASDVQAVLESDQYAEDVRGEERAAIAVGATGVPFFLFDRAVGVSGAQSVEHLVEMMEKARADVASES